MMHKERELKELHAQYADLHRPLGEFGQEEYSIYLGTTVNDKHRPSRGRRRQQWQADRLPSPFATSVPPSKRLTSGEYGQFYHKEWFDRHETTTKFNKKRPMPLTSMLAHW
eukprot:NODE_7045_length_476_cov_58.395785_g6234_i0.p1 GENE.NODE_7045_length_476_cov_58.395785_g6234_i0~~NODE_7045_length_476_cov_58.395785_g6234_i0.p1  ORF type:complete len:111 (+),score=22.67 NODE_7045_length_476_cov_58.395785_g6234_i0:49-381(+)